MLDTKEAALKKLEELSIPYEIFEHEAVYTIDEMSDIVVKTNSEVCKNLFVRNQKGNQHFLIVQKGEKRANLTEIGEKLGVGKLSFASPERLMKYLKLEKGEVTPLSVINDGTNAVTVVFDSDLCGLERVGVHPNTNTATVVLSFDDLLKYVENSGHKVKMIKI